MRHSIADPLGDEVTSNQPIQMPVLPHRIWNDEAARCYAIQLRGGRMEDALGPQTAERLTENHGQLEQRHEERMQQRRQLTPDSKGVRKGDVEKGKAPRKGSKGPGKGRQAPERIKGAGKGTGGEKGKGRPAPVGDAPWHRARAAAVPEGGSEPAAQIRLPPPPLPPLRTYSRRLRSAT